MPKIMFFYKNESRLKILTTAIIILFNKIIVINCTLRIQYNCYKTLYSRRLASDVNYLMYSYLNEYSILPIELQELAIFHINKNTIFI